METVTTEPVQTYVAISPLDALAYGCPYCGAWAISPGDSLLRPPEEFGGGCICTSCIECRRGFEIRTYKDASERGPWHGEEKFTAELVPHPRAGIPWHTRPDTPVDAESFRSRGTGMDSTPGCFVCGGDSGLRTNIAAFVSCREAGERVVAMFEHGARLDFRAFEPHWVQVKIGACTDHEPLLRELDEICRPLGLITPKAVTDVIRKSGGEK